MVVGVPDSFFIAKKGTLDNKSKVSFLLKRTELHFKIIGDICNLFAENVKYILHFGRSSGKSKVYLIVRPCSELLAIKPYTEV